MNQRARQAACSGVTSANGALTVIMAADILRLARKPQRVPTSDDACSARPMRQAASGSAFGVQLRKSGVADDSIRTLTVRLISGRK